MFKIKKVRPLFTGIITTARRYVSDTTILGTNLIDSTKSVGAYNLYQQVIAVGKMVTDIKEGDVVKLNYKRYLVPLQLPGKIEDNVQMSKMKAEYAVPRIILDEQECLFVQNNDVEFVVEEYEVDEGGLFQ